MPKILNQQFNPNYPKVVGTSAPATNNIVTNTSTGAVYSSGQPVVSSAQPVGDWYPVTLNPVPIGRYARQ